MQEADKERKKAVDRFVSFVRSAEGLYVSTTWEEFAEAFEKEEEFVAVSCRYCSPFVYVMHAAVLVCQLVSNLK